MAGDCGWSVAGGLEPWAGSEDRGSLREPWSEDRRQGPHRHLGSRRDTQEGRSDVCGQAQDATQSPRSRYQPGTGRSSSEARGRYSQLVALIGWSQRVESLDTGVPTCQFYLRHRNSSLPVSLFPRIPCKFKEPPLLLLSSPRAEGIQAM